jgi:hypothetical protein
MAAKSYAELPDASPDSAGDARINVLWWTYADPSSAYRTDIAYLSGMVSTIADASGLEWNLTFFDPTSPTPDFADYDVLVIESGEAFRTGAPGGPLANPDYSGILGNKSAIEAARGDRTFLSGADADFHAIRGDTGNVPDSEGGTCSPALSGPECWDGALGHLVNAINWAGSGAGLGIVSLVAAEFSGSEWWLHPDSFLRDELEGFVTIFGAGSRENTVVIPGSAAALPLNSGLTSPGLSDWDQSFHAGFSHDLPGYTPIVDAIGHPETAVAIASAATAGESTIGADVADLDGDGRADVADNCTMRANGPLIRDAGGHSQLDADGDGYGNLCDADLDNSGGIVNFTDLAIFRAAFGTSNAAADLNGSGGIVNFADLALFRGLFGNQPGPSGTAP